MITVKMKGIALILVLWIITILSVLAFSFSALVRTEMLAIRSFRNSVAGKALAEAGLERALFELVYGSTKKTDDAWKTDGTLYKDSLGDGYYLISITEESGKIDINMLTDASGIILKNLLMLRGLSEEEAVAIVDSLLDWKDSGDDDAHRLHGAESDYYLSLPVPYQAKNALFDTVEELLLIKGMRPEILYGGGGNKGIIDLLTVHAGTSKININSAPRDVLSSVPGITQEIADNIIAVRQPLTVSSPVDLQSIIDQIPAAATHIGSAGTSTYTIEAEGHAHDDATGYVLRATVTIPDNSRYRFVYFKSPVMNMP